MTWLLNAFEFISTVVGVVTLGLVWVGGMPIAAYLIGRFTDPDRFKPSSEIRDLAPFLVPAWPLAALVALVVIPFMLWSKLSVGVLKTTFELGDTHRIEWENNHIKLLMSPEEAAKHSSERHKKVLKRVDELHKELGMPTDSDLDQQNEV